MMCVDGVTHIDDELLFLPTESRTAGREILGDLTCAVNFRNEDAQPRREEEEGDEDEESDERDEVDERTWRRLHVSMAYMVVCTPVHPFRDSADRANDVRRLPHLEVFHQKNCPEYAYARTDHEREWVEKYYGLRENEEDKKFDNGLFEVSVQLPGVYEELARIAGEKYAELFTGPNSKRRRDHIAGRNAALYYAARYGF